MTSAPLVVLLHLAGCGSAPPVDEEARPPATFVALDPADGSLDDQLQQQAAKAREAGQAPFLQLYGDWCNPCKALRDAMPDPRMQDAFAGTWVVMVDTTLWANELEKAPWLPDRYEVPSFFQVRDDGILGGAITGGAWGRNVPEEMAPPLRRFFRTHGVP